MASNEIIEQQLKYIRSLPQYQGLKVFELFNSAFLSTLSSKFSNMRLISSSIGDLPHAVFTACVINGLQSVDEHLQPEDRMVNPLTKRLLRQKLVTHSVSMPDHKPLTQSSEVHDMPVTPKQRTYSEVAAEPKRFNRDLRRKYLVWAKHNHSKSHFYARKCTKTNCSVCKTLFHSVPLSWCSQRHSGKPCSPMGLYPHILDKNLSLFHNGKATPQRFRVSSGKFQNPLAPVTKQAQVEEMQVDRVSEVITNPPPKETDRGLNAKAASSKKKEMKAKAPTPEPRDEDIFPPEAIVSKAKKRSSSQKVTGSVSKCPHVDRYQPLLTSSDQLHLLLRKSVGDDEYFKKMQAIDEYMAEGGTHEKVTELIHTITK